MQLQTLAEGNYYHINNRGVNCEDIFKGEKNYFYFLQQYKKHCGDVFDTLAYASLRNHFHLLVYIKENVTVFDLNGDAPYLLYTSDVINDNSRIVATEKITNRFGNIEAFKNNMRKMRRERDLR